MKPIVYEKSSKKTRYRLLQCPKCGARFIVENGDLQSYCSWGDVTLYYMCPECGTRVEFNWFEHFWLWLTGFFRTDTPYQEESYTEEDHAAKLRSLLLTCIDDVSCISPNLGDVKKHLLEMSKEIDCIFGGNENERKH